MKNAKKIFPILFSLFLIGCANSSNENQQVDASFKTEKEMSIASAHEEISTGGNQKGVLPVSSIASKVDPHSPNKFIRTANLKFKVKKVSDATYAIESIVSKFSGYVVHTALQTKIDYSTNTLIAPDTLQESIHYKVYNDIIIKIPNYNLDTSLKEMANHIDFLDYRTIEANDITLKLLSSKLAEQRKQQHQKRLQQGIDKKGKKLTSIAEAEKSLNEVMMAKDAAYLRQLELNNAVEFSTINLHIYQNSSVRKEIHRKETTTPYQLDLTEQLISNLFFGWTILMKVFLFLIKFWSFFLVIFGIYFTVIYFKRNPA
jgi:hypothetical protein